MGINLKIKEFSENLVDVINKSDLPSGVVRMVLSNALDEVVKCHINDLQKEAEEVELANRDRENNGLGEDLQQNQLGE